MRDLDRALADIVAIRAQMARDTEFRGLGSVTLAATGALALATAGAQALWLDAPEAQPLAYFGAWIATACAAAAMIGVETVRRARRLHASLADEMVVEAITVFLPAGGAGACLALVLARFAPEQVWLLPGLWQLFVGLGLFAAARILPGPVRFAAAWYVLAGLAVIALAAPGRELSPWLSPWFMGLPFAVGQGLLSAIMHRFGGDDERA